MKAICIIVTDHNALYLANRVMHSFKWWHHDIPVFIMFNDAEYEEQVMGTVRTPRFIARAFAIKSRYIARMLKDYDTVISLDVDTVVVSYLYEMLNNDIWDAAVSYGESTFINAGVAAFRNYEFVREWEDVSYAVSCEGDSTTLSFLSSIPSKYKIKMLEGGSAYYNEKSRRYWSQLLLQGNITFAPDGKVIRVLHWAGGIGSTVEGACLTCNSFPDDIKRHLDALTGTNDFTKSNDSRFSDYLARIYGG